MAREALTPEEFAARPERDTDDRSTYGKEFTFDGETYIAGLRVDLEEREGGTEDIELIHPTPQKESADEGSRANGDALPAGWTWVDDNECSSRFVSNLVLTASSAEKAHAIQETWDELSDDRKEYLHDAAGSVGGCPGCHDASLCVIYYAGIPQVRIYARLEPDENWKSGGVALRSTALEEGINAEIQRWEEAVEGSRANAAEASSSDPYAPMSADFAGSADAGPPIEEGGGTADAGGDGMADEPELAAASKAPAEVATDWPDPQLDPVWEELPNMTKDELEETHREFRHEQWGRYSDHFRTSALKKEQFDHVRAQVRFHANLEAVHRLTNAQVEELHDWIREQTSGRVYYGDHHDALRKANNVLRSVADVENLGIMAEEAFDRFRLREIRRAGAFCYHAFYEELTAGDGGDAPPTCNMLRQLYDQAIGMQGPDAARALKQIRADIGRRQGATEDAQELDRLGDLHADVDRALEELAAEEAAAIA